MERSATSVGREVLALAFRKEQSKMKNRRMMFSRSSFAHYVSFETTTQGVSKQGSERFLA